MFRHVHRLCPQLPSSRAYATRTPAEALAARSASTPLAVRERREKKLGPTEPGQTDATPEGLTPSELARYERHKAMGTLPKVKAQIKGKEQEVDISKKEWLRRLNTRRSRIRGFRTVRRPVPGEAHNGQVKTLSEVQVVGQAVYLPNIIFRLVRNHTPPGQDYNPYEATFRVPPSITKTDIRSYLKAVYGVDTTYIRTDLYYGRLEPKGKSTRKVRSTYKRAVVGLVEPFYYPHRLEDMPEDERKARERSIEEQFFVQESKQTFTQILFRSVADMNRGGSSESWRFSGVTGRGKILAEVAKRRQMKEKMVAGLVGEWQKAREEGRKIIVEPPRRKEKKAHSEKGKDTNGNAA